MSDSAKAAVAEVEKVGQVIEGGVKKALGEAQKFATEDRIDISAEEKLIVTKMENEFLKASVEITRLETVKKNIQIQFPQYVESLVKKYFISPLTHQFDNVELAFKKKQ